MLILDTVGDTLQAEASAASSITITAYGIEAVGSVETYKKLGQSQLTGLGTQDTIYTVPASTSSIISVLIITNTSGSQRTVNIWHVPNGDSYGNDNALLKAVTVEANTTIVWNKGNIQIAPDISDTGMYKSEYDSDNDGLIDLSAGGLELDTSGVINGQLLIGNSGSWNLSTLTEGTGLTISNGGGSISLSTNDGEIDHNNLSNYAANRHFLQTDITNISTSLSTGLLKVTTGTGALSVITDNSSNWDTAYGWGDHAGLYDATGTASGLISTHESTYNHGNYNTAYSHSQLTSGNPHSVTPIELSLVIGTDVQAWDASLDSIAGLTYASDSFIKLTVEDTYAVRTIAETKSDLSLNLVENTALSTWIGSSNITTLGTIGTGVWNGTSIGTGYTDAKCTATWPNTYTANQDLETSDSPAFAGLDLTGITDSNIPYMSASGFADSILVANSSTLTFNVGGFNDLIYKAYNNYPHLEGRTSSQNTVLAICAADNDGTDSITLAFYPIGHVGDTNRELFQIGWVNSTNSFELQSRATGAGTLRPINLYTLTTGQLFLDTNNRIGINETSPITLLEMTGTIPYITLHNSTHEDSDGGRESRIIARGEQSGGEETVLGYDEWCHDGSADDEKGMKRAFANDGNDGTSPSVELYRFESDGGIFFPNIKSGTDQANAGAAAGELYIDTDTNVLMVGV